MNDDRHLSDHDTERLLSGHGVDPAWGGVAQYLAAIRRSADTPVGSTAAAEHVAMAVAAARVPLGQSAAVRSPQMLTNLYHSFAARVAALAAALVLATTGIAAAGVLPDGIQEPLADMYGVVGFNFHPDGDDGAGTGIDDEQGEDADDGDIVILEDNESADDDSGDDESIDDDAVDDQLTADDESEDDDESADDDDQATNDDDDESADDDDESADDDDQAANDKDDGSEDDDDSDDESEDD